MCLIAMDEMKKEVIGRMCVWCDLDVLALNETKMECKRVQSLTQC